MSIPTPNQGGPDPVKFARLPRCWVCGDERFADAYPALFDHSGYAEQDPELATYTGSRLAMRRCQHCGFIQPEALPTLPRYFDRMYDQHWSEAWIAQEFDSTYKDYIFRTILSELERRTSTRAGARSVLDIGAHVGKFLSLAERRGWQAEGIELNPRTAAYAAHRTGLPVHRINAEQLATDAARRYTAITLTDVLEHLPDPLSILRDAAGLLEPAGWIAIKVPCGPNQFTKERVRRRLGLRGMPEHIADNLVHINHFSPRSLRLALERSGFGSITLTVGAPELADGRFQPGIMNRWSNVFRRAVYQAGRWLPGGTRTPLAFNLQAYARKG